jgi:CheY-like chemotaxis protein
MEAVGQLTAGIAHHFNNMLMGILPNIQMAAEGASPELAPLLRDAEQAAVRAAEMVKQLSRFAGRGKPQPRRLEDLGQLVEQTLSMCRETFDRRIDLRLQRDPSAPAVVAEAIEVEHALMNVLINARDAVSGPAVTRPQIAISVERVAADAPEITEQPGARHVDHACVRITDNGVGMDAPTMERIYEPFFTTKGVGRGTGLGLSTTYSVVREHGGFIRCTSSVGRGTTFAIYLPAGEAVRPVNGARPTPGAVAAVAQRETILVVDDEPVVRSAVTRVLQSAGYRVETAGSGDEVLARYGAGINGIKLALVDVSMPGLAGPVLVQRLRERVGHLRVLYLTGYSMAAGPDPVVEKPVSPEALLRAVSDALAGP